MRICIAQNVSLSDHLALSTYLRSISKYLARKKDIELTLFTQKGNMIPEDLPKNIDIYEIDAELYSIRGNLKYSFGLYKQLKELKEKGNIDLIHCLYPNSSVLGAALFKRMSPKTRIVYDIRSPWVDMSIEKKNSMPKFAVPLYRNTAYLSERFLTKYVDGFIFITEGLKKFYEKKIRLNSKPFSIIPSGVDLDLFSKKSSGAIRDKYQLKNGEFLIGYVGVLSRMRELDFVLRALQKLADSGKNYRVMFVGGGEDKERLEKRAKEFKVGDKVIFTGQVPYETIPDYISTFDAAICHLPDKLIFKYSFPMKVLEYLACDIPVLASDIEAHTEIAKCVEGIFLYKDQHDIEISIRKMNNKKTGVSPTNYRWEIITQEIAKLYKVIWDDFQ